MSIKQFFAAVSVSALLVPTVLQAQTQVTPEQCKELGGVVNEEEGTCTGVDDDEAAAILDQNGLGGGLGEGAAAAGAGLLILLALGSSSSSSTTTTTTSP